MSLVLCSAQSLIAQSGKLCDAIWHQCVEARSACRRMDLSTCLAIFEFQSDAEAAAMPAATIPKVTFAAARPFYWMVKSIQSEHTGHSQPYRECEKNLYLSYAMKITAKAMAESGCSVSDIADYLSSRGCTGTLTDHRLKHHIDAVKRDMADFTAARKFGETEAQAMLRMLQEMAARDGQFVQQRAARFVTTT